MTKDEYKQQFSEDDAVGWLSIDKELETLYPNQEPKHFAPKLYFALGGEEPLDGLSVYESSKQEDHFHIISYGFSQLYYDEESAGEEYSKWGFELTFRLKKNLGNNNNPDWALNLIQNLAKYVFSSKKYFDEYHVFPANGPIRLDYDTDITALAFVPDPELGKIRTPNGEVIFLQLVGLTTVEYDFLKNDPVENKTEQLISELRRTNPLLITDLERK
jgi:Suppressor of fused protein (SUFU)